MSEKAFYLFVEEFTCAYEMMKRWKWKMCVEKKGGRERDGSGDV
jgi:hypothetical protein